VRFFGADRTARVHPLTVVLILGVLTLSGGDAFAQGDPSAEGGPPLPIACAVSAEDAPEDGGGSILVTWELTDPGGREDEILGFDVLRYAPGEEPASIGEVPATDTEYTDSNTEDGTSYQYVVRTRTPFGHTDSEPSPAAVSSAQWFAKSRLGVLVIAALFCGAVLLYIQRAKKGGELFIREIPGLEAVDDAVGRATEMGRPVLFVPGIELVTEVGTLAALTILGHVAKRVARHGTPLHVPCADPIVMATAQEIVKASYAEVGRPDEYDPSRVAYLTYDQFGYTAGVNGMMLRDRPEAVFLIGTFYAESLILAETGHSIGAIQIAGTKETSQLPFFVAACDYTLIGEELFAASSYLSREPVMLGSLKGQDLTKLWIVYVIIFMFVAGTVGYMVSADGGSALTKIFEFVKSWFN